MTSDTKELLVLNVESTAEWRARKAEEYPEDERNLQSANALSKLAESLAAMNDDDPLLQSWRRLWGRLIDAGHNVTEEESEYIGRYGFDDPAEDGTDAEGFLRGLIELLTDKLLNGTPQHDPGHA